MESCQALDIAWLRRWGWLVPGDARGGTVTWRSAGEARVTANLINPDLPSVHVGYTLDGERLSYRILLDRTFPRFGGVRWWFLCPLLRGDIECERRVGKVYLAGRYFGCRHCQELTYRSRQEHDARVSRLMKNPTLRHALIDSGDLGASYLALRAAAKLAERGRRAAARRR